MSSLFPRLPSEKYSIIYADPPWDYKGQTQHNGNGGVSTGGAALHYNTVKLQDLKNLEIGRICEEDCIIFMWSTSPHLDQAIDLMKCWGFSWATIGFVWDKQKVNPGFYTMSQCEICLIGKKGKIPTPWGFRNTRQFVSAKRESHSKKPNEVRARIMEMFPEQKKIELFARGSFPGWKTWGLES